MEVERQGGIGCPTLMVSPPGQRGRGFGKGPVLSLGGGRKSRYASPAGLLRHGTEADVESAFHERSFRGRLCGSLGVLGLLVITATTDSGASPVYNIQQPADLEATAEFLRLVREQDQPWTEPAIRRIVHGWYKVYESHRPAARVDASWVDSVSAAEVWRRMSCSVSSSLRAGGCLLSWVLSGTAAEFSVMPTLEMRSPTVPRDALARFLAILPPNGETWGVEEMRLIAAAYERELERFDLPPWEPSDCPRYSAWIPRDEPWATVIHTRVMPLLGRQGYWVSYVAVSDTLLKKVSIEGSPNR